MLFLFYALTDIFSIGCLLLSGVSPAASSRFQENFVSCVFLAPVFETLLVHLPLIYFLKKINTHPLLIILVTSIVFALLHFSHGMIYTLIIFYPGLMMTLNFYYFYTRVGLGVAILTTIFVHGVFNFTSLMC